MSVLIRHFVWHCHTYLSYVRSPVNAVLSSYLWLYIQTKKMRMVGVKCVLPIHLPSFLSFQFLKGQRYIYFVNPEMHSVLNTYKNMYVSGVEMNNSVRDRIVWWFFSFCCWISMWPVCFFPSFLSAEESANVGETSARVWVELSVAGGVKCEA